MEISKFSPPDTPSKLIAFEGMEGVGKSTQVQLLADHLREKGLAVSCLREPGGTSFGEKMREAILQSEEEILPLAEAHLFASSRAQLLGRIILPKLMEKNHVIILDRYLGSSLAYQGLGRNLGINTVLELHQHYPLTTLPHMTFILDLPIKMALQRAQKRGPADYFEKEGETFFSLVNQGLREYKRLFPQWGRIIDANGNPEEVLQKILLELPEGLNG